MKPEEHWTVSLKKVGLYLPFKTERYERFQRVCEEILAVNGEAAFVKAPKRENFKDNNLVRLFHKARDGYYAIITERCSEFSKNLSSAKGYGN